jgi:D-alanine-D-alanine ligase
MAKLGIAVLYSADVSVTPLRGSDRRKQKPPRIPLKRRRERRALSDREQVLRALQECGHEATLFEVRNQASLLELTRAKADLFFNMTESFCGDDAKEPHLAAFLELFDRRYTGSPPQSMFLAQDKAVAKRIFDFHGIHTPRFAVSWRGDLDIGHLEFPLIVKPVSEDGSVGIDKESVVQNQRDLVSRIAYLQERFDCAALVEEYVEGREIYAAVIGNDNPAALPLVEMDLSRLPEGMPRIASAEVKWEKGTQAYESTRSAAAHGLDAETTRRLQDTAVQVYAALGLRDYARVDMRLTDDGRIYVIEANPNPWLAQEAEMNIAASLAGRTYPQLIGQIVELALARY